MGGGGGGGLGPIRLPRDTNNIRRTRQLTITTLADNRLDKSQTTLRPGGLFDQCDSEAASVRESGLRSLASKAVFKSMNITPFMRPLPILTDQLLEALFQARVL